MKRAIVIAVFLALVAAVTLTSHVHAAPNCDLEPKPAFGCRPGYEMTCLGGRWRCAMLIGGRTIVPHPSRSRIRQIVLKKHEELKKTIEAAMAAIQNTR